MLMLQSYLTGDGLVCLEFQCLQTSVSFMNTVKAVVLTRV
jgi:hypothetical protein